jgi:glycosyltransferase 2 family protein
VSAGPRDPIEPFEPAEHGGSGTTRGAAAGAVDATDAGLLEEPVSELPFVNEDLRAGAVPLARRLRDPRTIISLVLPLLVLLLFMVALPGFKVDQLPSIILSADPWWLLAAVGIYYVGFPLRGMRWAILVRGIGCHISVRDSTEIIFISWLVNCVVPAKLGDVYRAWLLRINYAVSLSATFGTVFIERIFDLFAIVVLGLGAALWSFREGLSDQVKIIMLVGVIVIVVMAVGLIAVRSFGRRLLMRLPVPQRVIDLYDRFEDGVFAVGLRQVPVILVLTVLIWTTEALRLLFVVEAMPFDISLGVSGAFFVSLTASLLTAIPLTPAGLGIVEAGIVGILTVIYKVPPTEAAAIALVDRAISVLSVIVLGAIAYLLSNKTRGRSAHQGQPGEAEPVDMASHPPSRP